MLEGLPKQAFKGWDLTRGCWPREGGNKRKARQGETGGRTAPRGAAAPAMPGGGWVGAAPPPPSPVPLLFPPAPRLAEGCRSPARSPQPRSPLCRRVPGVAASPPPPPLCLRHGNKH